MHYNEQWHLPNVPQTYKQLIKRPTAEAVVLRCSVKKVLLKISQNSLEDTYKVDSKMFNNF